MKLTFSQRQGIVPIRRTLQVDSISDELRNALWTTIWIEFFQSNRYDTTYLSASNSFKRFSIDYWTKFLKQPIDTVHLSSDDFRQSFRKTYFDLPWHGVYDLVEFIADYSTRISQPIHAELNKTLEAELSAFRFVNEQLVDITSTEEITALEDAINDTAFAGVSAHLTAALKMYASRENPDYRNSIKESISAVESMVKIVTGSPKATLGEAMKQLGKTGGLHESLNQGFQKLYGYTSDEGGIRHAMLNEPNLSAADAKYFMLSCTSFVNYLKSKM